MLDIKMLSETGETRVYHIQGQNQKFKIYLIPLDNLKYNLQNGRIASYISQYQDENDDFPEDYNNVIEQFIVQSNETAFKKTKENIKRIGQIEPAIVLSDGTVIDGNRRFTVLRQLSREGEGSEFAYIKAAILEDDKLDPKEIKILELNLQHGREERVSYDPVEYLVDIYRDLIGNEAQFTPEEYARETQTNISKIKTSMRKSKIMIEFLDYINKPHKYHIARVLKLDGPITEIDKIIQSKKVDESMADEIKEYVFFNLAILKEGDTSRTIRSLKSICEDKDKFEEAVDDVEDSMEDLYDYFQEETYIEENKTFEVPEEIREKALEKTEEVIETEKHEQAQQKPVQSAKKALKQIDLIDLEAAIRMNESDKESLKKYLNEIIYNANRVLEKIDVK